jgi:tetratricopeptide (TPR) repeat protein
MWLEANEALENITPDVRHVPEVLRERVFIYRGLEKWEAMAAIAEKLAQWDPENPEYFLLLAYAKRRAESLEVADAILSRAGELHPAVGEIQFNLACYRAQLGRLAEAKAHLKRAIELEPRFKLMALEDQDLAPIW